MITYDAKKHRYYNDKGIQYISVTTLLNKYFPFNVHEVIEKITSNPNSKYYKRDKKEIMSEWNNTAVQGTRVHNVIDEYIKEKKYPEDPLLKICVEKFTKLNFKGKLISEVMVWDDELQIAGTTDILEDCGNMIWLYDTKTSNSIGDDKLEKYSYQVEIYRRLVEKQFKKPTKIGGIIWFSDYIKDQEKTKLKFLKTLECSKFIDDILEKRKIEIM